MTVTLANDTQILDRAGNAVSVSDLVANSKVILIGVPNGTDELQAQILLLPGTKQK